MVKIIQKGNAVLRVKAKSVPLKDITTSRIRKIIAYMKKLLAKEADGIGLAAVQIGVPLQIFIVSGIVFAVAKTADLRGTNPSSRAELTTGRGAEQREKEQIPPDLVFINPKVVKTSRKKEVLDEGCLSVRRWYGKVPRATKITIRAYDERGKPFERGATGLLAQIFQHEMDHLEGILFIDKATDLQKILSPKQQLDTKDKAV